MTSTDYILDGPLAKYTGKSSSNSRILIGTASSSDVVSKLLITNINYFFNIDGFQSILARTSTNSNSSTSLVVIHSFVVFLKNISLYCLKKPLTNIVNEFQENIFIRVSFLSDNDLRDIQDKKEFKNIIENIIKDLEVIVKYSLKEFSFDEKQGLLF